MFFHQSGKSVPEPLFWGLMEHASQLATPPVSSSRALGEIYVPAIEDVDAEQACEVATALCLQQRYEEALPFAEAALEEMKASHGSAHTRLCPYEVLLAQCFLALHDVDAAATHCRRALQIFAAKPPSEKVRKTATASITIFDVPVFFAHGVFWICSCDRLASKFVCWHAAHAWWQAWGFPTRN